MSETTGLQGNLPISKTQVVVHFPAHQTDGISIIEYLKSNSQIDFENLAGVLRPPLSRKKNAFAGIEKLSENIRMFIESHNTQKQSSFGTLLISDESYLGSISENLIQATAYKSLARRLLTLRCVIPRKSHICITIRDYIDWWESQIFFGLRFKADTTLNELKIAQIARTERGWFEVVADIERFFPDSKISVRRFEDISKDQKPQNLDFIDINMSDISIYDGARINCFGIAAPMNMEARLAKISAERSRQFIDTGRIFFQDEIELMRSKYALDKNRLADHLLERTFYKSG